jgi:asparagine synthase (glutamine-hydrolysing)
MSCIFGIVGDVEDKLIVFSKLQSNCSNQHTKSFDTISNGIYSLGAFTFFEEQKNITTTSDDIIMWADIRLSNRKKLKQTFLINELNDDISDTELALTAYKKWNEDFVHHLSGEYVIVIIHQPTNTLQIFTDPLGIRPLHYTFQNGVFYFSSFLHQLHELSHLSFSCNMNYIHRAVCSLFSMDETETAFNEIQQLPRSSTLTLKGGKIRINSYEYFNINPKPLLLADYDAYLEKFREKLNQAVVERIPLSAKAIGIEFSGGFDSVGISSIAVPYCKDHKIDFHAYPYVLPNEDVEGHKDNRKVIDAAAEYLEIKELHYIGKEKIEIQQMLDKYIEEFHQPYTSSTWINLHEIEKTKNAGNVQLIFSGLGGDQCVSMNSVRYILHLAKSSQFLKLFRQGEVTSYKRMLKIILRHNLILSFFYKRKRNGLSKKLKPLKGHEGTLEVVLKKITYHNHEHNNLNDQIYKMITLPQLRHRMLLEQTAAYHFGKEMSYPFFDAELVQFMLAVPTKHKLKDKKTRVFYKDAITKWINLPIFLNHKKSDPIGNSNPNFVLHLWEQIETLRSGIKNILSQNNHYNFIDEKIYDKIGKKRKGIDGMITKRIYTILTFLEKFNAKKN